MALLKLDIEDEEGFELLGIQSSWSEHRLVWVINQCLAIKLSRTADFVIRLEQNPGGGGLFVTEDKKEFSVFRHEGESETITLVANLGQGLALYDKGRKFDYLMRIESGSRSLQECGDIVAEQRGVLAVGKIECDPGDRAAKPFNELD